MMNNIINKNGVELYPGYPVSKEYHANDQQPYQPKRATNKTGHFGSGLFYNRKRGVPISNV